MPAAKFRAWRTVSPSSASNASALRRRPRPRRRDISIEAKFYCGRGRRFLMERRLTRACRYETIMSVSSNSGRIDFCLAKMRRTAAAPCAIDFSANGLDQKSVMNLIVALMTYRKGAAGTRRCPYVSRLLRARRLKIFADARRRPIRLRAENPRDSSTCCQYRCAAIPRCQCDIRCSRCMRADNRHCPLTSLVYLDCAHGNSSCALRNKVTTRSSAGENGCRLSARVECGAFARRNS